MDLHDDGYIPYYYQECWRIEIVTFDTSSTSGVEARLVHPVPRVSVMLDGTASAIDTRVVSHVELLAIVPLIKRPCQRKRCWRAGLRCCTE